MPLFSQRTAVLESGAKWLNQDPRLCPAAPTHMYWRRPCTALSHCADDLQEHRHGHQGPCRAPPTRMRGPSGRGAWDPGAGGLQHRQLPGAWASLGQLAAAQTYVGESRQLVQR